MSARQQLVDILEPALPEEWVVLDFERDLGDIRAPHVMVSTSALEQGPAGGVWSATMRLLLVAPHEDYATAERMLEDGVLVVLRALDRAIPSAITLRAERTMLEPKGHAFRVDLTFPLPKE